MVALGGAAFFMGEVTLYMHYWNPPWYCSLACATSDWARGALASCFAWFAWCRLMGE